MTLYTSAAKIDTLLERAALEYQKLPAKTRTMAFREALSRLGLPGGYTYPGTVARRMSDGLTAAGLKITQARFQGDTTI